MLPLASNPPSVLGADTERIVVRVTNLRPINIDHIDTKLFWSKVFIRSEKECWEWKAGRYYAGYGKFHIDRVGYYAHRIAFTLTHKYDPKDLRICHTCDNPPCCNPSHLFEGTMADNMLDKVLKGRARGNVNRGESVATSRLTNRQADQIRKLYLVGYRQHEIASMFQIAQTTVSGIVRHQTY